MRTPARQNSLARVGTLMITEVNYHPDAPSQEALAIESDLSVTDLQFVEIHNPTDQAADLTRWRLRGAVDFDFAEGDVIGAAESMVLVGFDPTAPENESRLQAFRTHYGTQAVNIGGAFAGQLSDSFDRVTFERDASTGGQQSVFVVEDEVVYDDRLPWPIDADGQGSSLQRNTLAGYGNDPNSWRSARPEPGSASFASPLKGDFNADQRIDAVDVDLLCAQLGSDDNSFDLNADGEVTPADHEFLIRSVLNSDFGDASLDGRFDSSDLVLVFRAGEYEDALANNSGWRDGDWNCDGEFDTGDLVHAFQAGGYRQG